MLCRAVALYVGWSPAKREATGKVGTTEILPSLSFSTELETVKITNPASATRSVVPDPRAHLPDPTLDAPIRPFLGPITNHEQWR